MRGLLVVLPLILLASQPRTSLAQEPPIEVLLIGDSITVGVVSGADGLPYPKILRSHLGADFEVTNIGCGGTTSLDWTLTQASPWCGAERVAPNLFEGRALPNLPAAFVALLLGTNDAVGFMEPEPISIETYAAAIDEIVANLIVFGADNVILLTPPPRCFEDADIPRRLRGYRRAILTRCSEFANTLCGPDLYAILDLDLHFANCDPHPNALGHEVIASELSETIVSIVPEPDGYTSFFAAMGALVVLAWRVQRRRPSCLRPAERW
jgi:lysophospholipase L1-like esterase